MDALSLRELSEELLRLRAELSREKLSLTEKQRLALELACVLKAIRKITR